MHEKTQIVVVRRDLFPLVQVSVQGGHAIGKATYMHALALQVAGHPEAQVATADPNWGHPYRVWKGVQNEAKLLEVEQRLKAAGIRYEIVVEPDDGPLKGQATALATWYYDKAELDPAFATNDVYELRFEGVPAFKDEAIKLVVKQLQAQGRTHV